MKVLKLTLAAAFGRLCVETKGGGGHTPHEAQPPSGGCVLKPRFVTKSLLFAIAAAFGRLCVETF